jgi:hypothetical protein
MSTLQQRVNEGEIAFPTSDLKEQKPTYEERKAPSEGSTTTSAEKEKHEFFREKEEEENILSQEEGEAPINRRVDFSRVQQNRGRGRGRGIRGKFRGFRGRGFNRQQNTRQEGPFQWQRPRFPRSFRRDNPERGRGAGFRTQFSERRNFTQENSVQMDPNEYGGRSLPQNMFAGERGRGNRPRQSFRGDRNQSRPIGRFSFRDDERPFRGRGMRMQSVDSFRGRGRGMERRNFNPSMSQRSLSTNVSAYRMGRDYYFPNQRNPQSRYRNNFRRRGEGSFKNSLFNYLRTVDMKLVPVEKKEEARALKRALLDLTFPKRPFTPINAFLKALRAGNEAFQNLPYGRFARIGRYKWNQLPQSEKEPEIASFREKLKEFKQELKGFNKKKNDIQKELQDLQGKKSLKIKYLSAFRLFRKEIAPKYKEEQPELPPKERIEEIKKKWKALAPDEKMVYVMQSRADKERAIFESRLSNYTEHIDSLKNNNEPRTVEAHPEAQEKVQEVEEVEEVDEREKNWAQDRKRQPPILSGGWGCSNSTLLNTNTYIYSPRVI